MLIEKIKKLIIKEMTISTIKCNIQNPHPDIHVNEHSSGGQSTS